MTTNKPLFYSKKWRINNLYKIVDAKSQSTTFRRNEAQLYVERLTLEWKKRNPDKPLRRIILKARQQGITTDSLIYNLDDVLTIPNWNVAIIAHEEKKLPEIFMRVKYAYDHFLPQGGISLSDGKKYYKPLASLNNANQLYFRALHSQMKVMLNTKSGTYSAIHITELAFRNDAELMIADTLPTAQYSDITIESTANGVGNYFHQLWSDNYVAEDPERLCIFLPRYISPKYATPLDGPLKLPEELKFLDTLMRVDTNEPLSPEQKNRYYRMRKTAKRLAFQEYPSTPEEAFLTSGSTVFDSRQLRELTRMEYEKDAVYPELRIFRRPPGKLLIAGIDTAKGGPNGDYSALTLRSIDMRLYATYYGKIPPDKLVGVVKRLFALGYIFLINPEINNTGLTTVIKIKEDIELLPYLVETESIDKKTNTPLQTYGRNTTSKSRPILTGEYEEAVREGYITEFDDRQIAELHTLIYDNRKKMVAGPKSHDDFFMADGITYQTRHRYYEYSAYL